MTTVDGFIQDYIDDGQLVKCPKCGRVFDPDSRSCKYDDPDDFDSYQGCFACFWATDGKTPRDWVDDFIRGNHDYFQCRQCLHVIEFHSSEYCHWDCYEDEIPELCFDCEGWAMCCHNCHYVLPGEQCWNIGTEYECVCPIEDFEENLTDALTTYEYYGLEENYPACTCLPKKRRKKK